MINIVRGMLSMLLCFGVVTQQLSGAEKNDGEASGPGSQAASAYDASLTRQRMEVASFDHEGYWKVQYSRFRSANWDKANHPVPHYRSISESGAWMDVPFEDPNSWMRWVGNTAHRSVTPPHPEEIIDEDIDDADKIMGVRASFDFSGYNWFNIFPAFTRGAGLSEETVNGNSKNSGTVCRSSDGEIQDPCASFSHDGKVDGLDKYPFLLKRRDYNISRPRAHLSPAYVGIPGRTLALEFWVWGQKSNYSLELFLEDYKGNVHILPGIKLDFLGWKKALISVPSSIPQSTESFPRSRGLRFLKFKITSSPSDKPDGFYVYFDKFMSVLNLHMEPVIGSDLSSHPAWLPQPSRDSQPKPESGAKQ